MFTIKFNSVKAFADNEVKEVTIVSASLIEAKESKKVFLKLNLKDAETNEPMEALSYVGSEYPQQLVFGGILGQLNVFGSDIDPIVEINKCAGKTLKIKRVLTESEDPLTGQKTVYRSFCYNPADF